MIANKPNSKTGYYSAAGKVLFAPRMKLGMNVGNPPYYEPTMPFINIIHSAKCYVASGSPTLNANGWYDCTAGGKVALHHNPENVSVKDGVWILKWGSAAGNVSMTVTNANITSTAANRLELTVTDGVGIGTAITYEKGLPSFAALVHSDDEALYDAGQLVNPRFVTDLTGYDVIRFLDWVQVNNGALVGDEYTTHYTKKEYAVWHTHSDLDLPGYPIEAIAQLCNLTGADCWVTVPHKISYAAKVAMAQDLFDNLDSNIKIYPEIGNENWNLSGGFKDCTNWFDFADAPTRDVTIDANASVTDVGHGMSTGDEVVTYTCLGGQGGWPYQQGYTLAVIVDDVDHYRIARDATAALAGEDILTTPHASKTWDTTKTRLVLKRKADSVKSNGVNYAEASIETWDAFISVFGAERVVQVGAGWVFGPSATVEKCAVAEFKNRCDLYAIGGYYDFNDMPSFETATNAERSAYLRENNSANSIKSHAAAFGRNIVGIYEGSNHNYTTTSGSAKDLAMQDYARSTEQAQDLKWWLELHANSSCQLFTFYNSHSVYKYSGCWGLREALNEVNEQSQVIQTFIDNGGVDNG